MSVSIRCFPEISQRDESYSCKQILIGWKLKDATINDRNNFNWSNFKLVVFYY
jgi:hypothetical protein